MDINPGDIIKLKKNKERRKILCMMLLLQAAAFQAWRRHAARHAKDFPFC